ncbi:hypothetical protein QL093DRAFT_1280194 [Fusarium oxysporum]|nr:hypothetical protein QL093DRAFT_1280194 [Fusarium oxysporum]
MNQLHTSIGTDSVGGCICRAPNAAQTAESEYPVAKQRALEEIGPRGFGQLQFAIVVFVNRGGTYTYCTRAR